MSSYPTVATWIGGGLIMLGLFFILGDAAGSRGTWFWELFGG